MLRASRVYVCMSGHLLHKAEEESLLVSSFKVIKFEVQRSKLLFCTSSLYMFKILILKLD